MGGCGGTRELDAGQRRVLNTFGDSPRQPLPNGRGSVAAALISRGLLSRDRQGAVRFRKTVKHRVASHK